MTCEVCGAVATRRYKDRGACTRHMKTLAGAGTASQRTRKFSTYEPERQVVRGRKSGRLKVGFSFKGTL